MDRSDSITVVIPSYNRTKELSELLDSILGQSVLPEEVVICEDHSPEREQIAKIVLSYRPQFENKAIKLVYEENEQNLGYDKNLRKGIELSSSSWAFVMGNDDLLLPSAVGVVKEFVTKHSDINFISRTFIRFNNNINQPLGVSRISMQDNVFDRNNSEANIIFRTGGFVGGLVINTAFARSISTTEFDGSLYYQIYLAASAYCDTGIGYISEPIVGGRADNPPMFGNADDDKALHVPGSYTAKGRASMWRGVLTIARSVGEKHHVDLYSSLHKELMVRQSFHVFEMNAGQSVQTNRELKTELARLGLMSHFIPRGFYMLNCILGRHARHVYKMIRKNMQAN
jgi:glycosyltransferase involved in cell wall biosynthesis